MKRPIYKKMLQLIVFCFMLVALSGCGWLYQSHNSSVKASNDISSAGLTVPAFEFTNQANEAFGTEQLKDQYWLANMIFTRCPTVCGLMTPNMKMLQDSFTEKGIDIKFITFTVDPDFDTPEVLAAYGENNGADFSKWTFLTGYSKDEIVSFARDSFQTLVQDTDGDDIMHGTSFFLIDGDGNVIRKYDGLSSDQTNMIKDIEAVYQR